MSTLTYRGEALEHAVALAEATSGYEASAGCKDAIFHVGQFIATQDAGAFNEVYTQLTDPSDNSAEYIAYFVLTVTQLTEILSGR